MTNTKTRPPVVGQINHIEHLKKSLTSAGDDLITGLHAMEAEAHEKEVTLAELDRKIEGAEAKLADVLQKHKPVEQSIAVLNAKKAEILKMFDPPRAA